MSVVRVIADWHRSNYDDTGVGTLTIGEVGRNRNAWMGEAGVLERVNGGKFREHCFAVGMKHPHNKLVASLHQKFIGVMASSEPLCQAHGNWIDGQIAVVRGTVGTSITKGMRNCRLAVCDVLSCGMPFDFCACEGIWSFGPYAAVK